MKSLPYSPPSRRRGRPRAVRFTADQSTRFREALIRHGVTKEGKPLHGVFAAIHEIEPEFPEFTFSASSKRRQTNAAFDAVQAIIETLP